MAGVHGECMYGYVDRVPGLCYVGTIFYHFNFVPIVPMRSIVVSENNYPGLPPQMHRIPMNLKSVLIGYFRGWVGLATVILFAYCGLNICEILLDAQRDDLIQAVIIGTAVMTYLAVWWAIIARHRSWIIAWLITIAATGAYLVWDAENPPPPRPANPFKEPVPRFQRLRQDMPNFLISGHGCLLALSVLRTFDRAGRRRAYELGEILGIPEDEMDLIWEQVAGTRPDNEPSDQDYQTDPS